MGATTMTSVLTYKTTARTAAANERLCMPFDFPACDPLIIANNYFAAYGVIFAFILGIPGNLLTVVILGRMRPFNSSSVWLIFMAFTDLFSLSMRAIISQILENHADIWHDWSCKFFSIMTDVCEGSVYFFLVGLTIERFIAVWFPLKMNIWCTQRRAVTGVLAVYVVILAFSIHMVETMRVDLQYNCIMKVKYQTFWKFIYQYYIQTTFMILLPVVLVSVLNIFIIIRLRASRKFQTQMTDQQTIEKNRQQRQIDRMLTSASVWFIVCVSLEIVLSYGNTNMFPPLPRQRDRERAQIILLTFSSIMRLYNHAANFVLYVMAARKFRSEVIRLLTFNMYEGFGKRVTSVSKISTTVTKVTSDDISHSG